MFRRVYIGAPRGGAMAAEIVPALLSLVASSPPPPAPMVAAAGAPAHGADALCVLMFVFGLFVPATTLIRFFDDGDTDWRELPAFLLAAFATLIAAYAPCVLLGAPAASPWHWAAVSAGYILCLVHAARAAGVGCGSRLQLPVFLVVGACAASAAFRTHAERAEHCTGVFTIVSLALALTTHRLYRGATGADAHLLDAGERLARRRLARTLAACVLAVAVQPAAGGCGGPFDQNFATFIQTVADLLVFVAAADFFG